MNTYSNIKENLTRYFSISIFCFHLQNFSYWILEGSGVKWMGKILLPQLQTLSLPKREKE